MELKTVLEKRFSIRKFLDADVPDEKIKEIIELAKLAPSAGNLQAFRVVIARERLTNIDAPVNLVICADTEASARRYGERGRGLYSVQDATIFAAYLQLVITDMGLASVWIGAFRENKIRRILGIRESLRPVAIICLGYPAVVKSGERRRKSAEMLLEK